MKFTLIIVFITLLSIKTGLVSKESNMNNIDVFYKQLEPSQRALQKVKKVLACYETTYQISYYDILDKANHDIILSYGLPSEHFPIAVVIGGKYSAKIEDRIVSFVHFPDFMKGIGRHEGNWSLDDLKAVLEDNSLLLKDNILPEIVDDDDHDKEN